MNILSSTLHVKNICIHPNTHNEVTPLGLIVLLTRTVTNKKFSAEYKTFPNGLLIKGTKQTLKIIHVVAVALT